MRTLVIIPAYNESGSICNVVDNLIKNYPEFDYVVVNDGSRDSTARLCREHGYNLLDLPVNLGLAGAFQTGMKYAMVHGYDAAVQFDGDGQHRPEFIAPLQKSIADGYNIAIGSRFVEKERNHSLRMAGNRLLSFFLKLTTGSLITDPTSGMRMFDRSMIEILATQVNLGPEPDTVAYLIRSGARVHEVQVDMDERTTGESYLNPIRSIHYMATMCVSILLVQWFRGKLKLSGFKKEEKRA